VTDGLKLLGDADTWRTVADQLAKLGIHMDIDKATGQVKGFTTDTKAEADALRDYLQSKFGPDGKSISPKLEITVTPAPLMSNDEARDRAGLPSEIRVGIKGEPLTPDNLPNVVGVPNTSPPPGQQTGPGLLLPGGVPLHPSGFAQIPRRSTCSPPPTPGP
jgi:hypothetical protein